MNTECRICCETKLGFESCSTCMKKVCRDCRQKLLTCPYCRAPYRYVQSVRLVYVKNAEFAKELRAAYPRVIPLSGDQRLFLVGI